MPQPQLKLIVPHVRRPKQRLTRFSRAIWQDTRALLREFRRPLLAIFFAIFVGGWLYGKLLALAGQNVPPYVDLPYFMLALMVLESPTDVPAEYYLVVFWYLQPAIGIYIVGQGAVDFIRLFFNRTERRSAWELAVAQTYRQHIVLIGVGHVGLRVARTLVQMGFEVVAIDEEDVNADADTELAQLDIPLVIGDARLTTIASNAGVQHARAVIICTSNDHVNLEITMRTRDLAPNARIVTRLWDARFAEQLKRFLDVEVMSASDLAAPAFAGSALNIEITQTLQVGGIDYSMIKLIIMSGSFMEGKTIDTLQDDEHVDIVLHGVGDNEPNVHPAGETLVQSGDTLVLFAPHSKITEIVSRNRPE
ncbi:MAG: TrkA family potassium uptake protein [Anaerolineae bacterium]|nr:TrkA family potassium uptake protein [Anaerolineae bacterium]MDQ7035785.1 TrkA family potassium uptake protein [Anaerolineae bacterium]